MLEIEACSTRKTGHSLVWSYVAEAVMMRMRARMGRNRNFQCVVISIGSLKIKFSTRDTKDGIGIWSLDTKCAPEQVIMTSFQLLGKKLMIQLYLMSGLVYW